MKGLGMNKMLGTIKRRATGSVSSSAENPSAPPPPSNESPETAAYTAVKQFCSSDNKTGDEVLYLPTIVDAAESSPAAAAECARLIRKYLSRNYVGKPSYQYNAIMLIRILADNPGPTFTRNFDKKFIDSVRDLLKMVKDRSVLNLLMETLDAFEYTQLGDEGLIPLVEMWQQNKEKTCKTHGYSPSPRPPPQHSRPPFVSQQNSFFTHSPGPAKLPSPDELASRLEEASTSAKLLTQFVTNSTAQELLANDLVKEFASRCQSASKSIQSYMASENPAPDHETMESLLDTNEQLQAALNAHQRAALSAKKSLGIAAGGTTPTPGTPSPDDLTTASGAVGVAGAAANGSGSGSGSASRSGSQSRRRDNGKGREEEPLPPLPRENNKGKGAATFEPPPGPPPGKGPEEDPFRDPEDEPVRQGGSSYLGNDTLAFESFNPGFTPAGSASGSKMDRTDNDDIYDSAPRK